MMIRTILLLLALLLPATLAGCDSIDAQRTFEDEASRVPEGITRMDVDGNLISADESDWRTSPAYRGLFAITVPAYPNPARLDQFMTIQFRVTGFDTLPGGLYLRGFTDTGRAIILDERRDATSSGIYWFTFSPSLLRDTGNPDVGPRIYRVFIFDARQTLVSYGDIQIQ
jgi:hypothetical protein